MLLDGIGHAVAAYDRRVIVARMAAGRQAKAQRKRRSRAQGGKLPMGTGARDQVMSRWILKTPGRCVERLTS
jgi:hypothetical protein